MRVRGVGRTARAGDDVFEEISGSDRLREALPWAHVVVNVLPLTVATRHMFGVREFGAMKSTAWFVNVGRGATVDQGELIDALQTGAIAGAALDVFEEEPLPPDSPLWSMASVIVSPHMSADVEGWQSDVIDLFADNLRRYLAGEPLRNVVDKRLGYPFGS